MSKTKVKYNDSWMYILLLSTLIMLINSLYDYTFKIKDIELTCAIFLVPFIYTITNTITKKYGFKKGLTAIGISTLALIAFILLMHFAIGKELALIDIFGVAVSYLVSQIVNIMIYKFLLANTSSPYILVLLNHLFSIIVFYIMYTLIDINAVIKDSFWLTYFIVLSIQTVICIPLTIIDKKIPAGIGKED